MTAFPTLLFEVTNDMHPNFIEWENGDCIQVAQERVEWQVLVNIL
jgi:hypothetical protein